jgi:tripartite-type tricarboxylate transporter receptor subunit TctC
MIHRRLWLACASVALTLSTLPGAHAQGYPNKPIRLIVPYAPGGAVDQTARTISDALGAQLGQSVVVDNKAGASGSLGAGELHRSKPDGYTLMVTLDPQAVNHHIIKNLPYDTFAHFDYLNLLVTTPLVLVASNKVPAKNLDELVTYLQANPKSAYGSAGVASSAHINATLLSMAKGLKTEHVPYKGAGPLLTDLLGGHVDYAFAGLTVMLPHIKEGKLKAIAVSSAKRSVHLPDVPTVGESIPGFEYPSWIGLVAPTGLPADVRDKILKAANAVMQNPQVAKRFTDAGFDIVNSTPKAFAERVRKDSDVMADLIQRKVVMLD